LFRGNSPAFTPGFQFAGVAVGLLAGGLFLGLLRALWHMPAGFSGIVGSMRAGWLLWFGIFSLSPLTAYRILMTPVHTRTRSVRVAGHVCVGRQSEVFPWQGSACVGENIAGAKMVFYEKSGHVPFCEEPDNFNRVVRDFAICRGLPHRDRSRGNRAAAWSARTTCISYPLKLRVTAFDAVSGLLRGRHRDRPRAGDRNLATPAGNRDIRRRRGTAGRVADTNPKGFASSFTG
jgi:hypothetical protein